MDELVTHQQVVDWLPRHVARAIELAKTPEQRGWFTESEAADYDGNLIEIADLRYAERRYIKGR